MGYRVAEEGMREERKGMGSARIRKTNQQGTTSRRHIDNGRHAHDSNRHSTGPRRPTANDPIDTKTLPQSRATNGHITLEPPNHEARKKRPQKQKTPQIPPTPALRRLPNRRRTNGNHQSGLTPPKMEAKCHHRHGRRPSGRHTTRCPCRD